MESFNAVALTEAALREDITPRGAAWLDGYRSAQTHANYADAYGGDPDAMDDVPEKYTGDLAGTWRAGWQEYGSDRDNGLTDGA
jgi:hypothetical protein